MGSIQNTVHYCCMSRDNQIMYTYNGGDHDTECLAALCLEKTPSFHKWYLETMGNKTFGFLMEDGFVYFAIVDAGLGSTRVLKFLEHLRDEFKKAARRGSRGSFSGINCTNNVQDQLVPVIRRLITSLEHVSRANSDWRAEAADASEQIEVANSTKAPLLGRSGKADKKAKDHVIALRDVELEEHRKSADRGNRSEAPVDSDNPAGAMPLQKDYVPRRGRSGSQSMERKWRRQVQIVLAIDAAVCLTLFGIWLAVCQGIECTRS